MSDIVVIVQNAMTSDSGMTGLFGTNVWPVELPEAPDYPAVVLTKVSGLEEGDMDGDTMFEQARLQVDVYAEGYAELAALKEAVRQFMVQRPPPGPPCAIDRASCINDLDLPAPDVKRAGPRRLRRRMLEFMIWTRRA